MSDNVPQFRRLSARALDAALLRLDLSNAAFCYLTGVNPKTLRRWLLDQADDNSLTVPFWVTTWLAAAAHPAALDAIRAAADANFVEASRDNA